MWWTSIVTKYITRSLVFYQALTSYLPKAMKSDTVPLGAALMLSRFQTLRKYSNICLPSRYALEI